MLKTTQEGSELAFYTSLGNTLLSNSQFARLEQLRKSFLKTTRGKNHVTPETSSLIQTLQWYQPPPCVREGKRLSPPSTTLTHTQYPRANGTHREYIYVLLGPAADIQCSPPFHIPTWIHLSPTRARGLKSISEAPRCTGCLPQGPPRPQTLPCSRRPAKGSRDQRWRRYKMSKQSARASISPSHIGPGGTFLQHPMVLLSTADHASLPYSPSETLK